MSLTLKTAALVGGACLLVFGDDPTWKRKPMSGWISEEAKQVLTDSLWAQSVTPQWVRDLSADERRAGGDMEADQGKGRGVGRNYRYLRSCAGNRSRGAAHAKPDGIFAEQTAYLLFLPRHASAKALSLEAAGRLAITNQTSSTKRPIARSLGRIA
jgi:hypothetical protein